MRWKSNVSRDARKLVFWVSDLSQKNARCLKFWIKVEEGLYYPCSENKGADQLRSYCEADLCLCFLIYAKIWFSYGTVHVS